jgi:membrane protease YdiL (CAAX protease family)
MLKNKIWIFEKSGDTIVEVPNPLFSEPEFSTDRFMSLFCIPLVLIILLAQFTPKEKTGKLLLSYGGLIFTTFMAISVGSIFGSVQGLVTGILAGGILGIFLRRAMSSVEGGIPLGVLGALSGVTTGAYSGYFAGQLQEQNQDPWIVTWYLLCLALMCVIVFFVRHFWIRKLNRDLLFQKELRS